MHTKTKPHRETRRFAGANAKITGRLKAYLLISFTTVMICIVALALYALTLEREGMEMKKVCLAVTVLALFLYFIWSFVKGYLAARAQRKHIIEMTTRLTEQELLSPGPETKEVRATETDALIRKIVQAINA